MTNTPGDNDHPIEMIEAIVEIERNGRPLEKVTVEFKGRIDHPELARKIAAVLDLEAEEIAAVLAEPEHFHHDRHHGHLKLVCIDLHFETESIEHHFLPSAKWERVHRWGCKKFKIASDACANLELHSGAADGPALNEAKPIGHHEGCLSVWLVKPGPERNG